MFINSEGIGKGNTKQLDWHNLFDSSYGRRQWGSGWRSVENYFLGFINIDNHCVISSHWTMLVSYCKQFGLVINYRNQLLLKSNYSSLVLSANKLLNDVQASTLTAVSCEAAAPWWISQKVRSTVMLFYCRSMAFCHERLLAAEAHNTFFCSCNLYFCLHPWAP